MTREDWVAVTKDLATTTREFVTTTIGAAVVDLRGVVGEFSGRLQSLEERIGGVKDGSKGDTGPPGRDADVSALEAMKSEIDGLRTTLSSLQAQPDMVAIIKSVATELDAHRPSVEPIDEDAIAQTVSKAIADHRDATREAIETAVTSSIAALPKPIDGHSVTVDDVLPMIAAEVTKAVSAIPPAQDGARGQDGSSVDASAVEAWVQAHVEKSIAALPKPQDGRSIAPEDVAPLITAEVSKAVEALPKPQDGKPGADGVSVAGALIDREGGLVLTLSSGETKSLGRVVGGNGSNGSNGQDGINLDFFTCEITKTFDPDTRTFTERYAQGDRERVVMSTFAGMPAYRGVYKAGQSYEAGDVVSYNHVWIAKEATTIKPEEHSAASAKVWTMLMRRGNRGEPGKPGDKGDSGARGPQGDRGPAWQS